MPDLPATYCCLEVDDYGKFDRKARTPVANVENDVTTWDQAYELEINGAQQLKAYICFKSFRVKEETIARGSLSVSIPCSYHNLQAKYTPFSQSHI